MPDALGLVLLLFLPTFIPLFRMMPVFGGGCWCLVFLFWSGGVRLQVFCLILSNIWLLFDDKLFLALHSHRDLTEWVHDLWNLLWRLIELWCSRIIWIWKIWFLLDDVVSNTHMRVLRSYRRWRSLTRFAVFSHIDGLIAKTLVQSGRLRCTSIGLLFEPVIGTQLTVKFVHWIQFLLGYLRR